MELHSQVRGLQVRVGPAMAVDELAPFLVDNFQEIDKTRDRGSGSFGSVYHVVVNGFPCIAKRLHDILVGQNVSEEERRHIRRRFREECILLSSLRHPNVVQFIGIHYGASKDDLTLVMERLYTDLELLPGLRTETQCMIGILLTVQLRRPTYTKLLQQNILATIPHIFAKLNTWGNGVRVRGGAEWGVDRTEHKHQGI